jgi:hypothetical protein
MLSQLVLAIVAVFYQLNIVSSCSLGIMLSLWIFTFTSFAPLHHKISEGNTNQSLLQLLIRRNWIRVSFLLFMHLLIMSEVYTKEKRSLDMVEWGLDMVVLFLLVVALVH